MHLMDIAKKVATLEACVHFLEEMRCQSVVVWKSVVVQ